MAENWKRFGLSIPGPNLEAVLDRLPTSRVVGHDARGYPIAEAEVFSGNGLDMWLKSQGDWVELEKTTDQKESDACPQSGHGVQ